MMKAMDIIATLHGPQGESLTLHSNGSWSGPPRLAASLPRLGAADRLAQAGAIAERLATGCSCRRVAADSWATSPTFTSTSNLWLVSESFSEHLQCHAAA